MFSPSSLKASCSVKGLDGGSIILKVYYNAVQNLSDIEDAEFGRAADNEVERR